MPKNRAPVISDRVLDVILAIAADHAIDSVVMSCTEITMLLGQSDVWLPVFDTTRLHAESAMAFALRDA